MPCRWFTYALSFNLETSMDSGLCAISPKHRYRTSYTTRACAPPLRAREREREIAREIAHSVTQLKAGAFQMFHRVYRVTERPRASRIVPNRPRGCSLCLGAHGRFGLLCGANSATRREAPCAPPWAVWDDPRLSRYLHGAPRTLTVQDNDKRGPQSPRFILTDF